MPQRFSKIFAAFLRPFGSLDFAVVRVTKEKIYQRRRLAISISRLLKVVRGALREAATGAECGQKGSRKVERLCGTRRNSGTSELSALAGSERYGAVTTQSKILPRCHNSHFCSLCHRGILLGSAFPKPCYTGLRRRETTTAACHRMYLCACFKRAIR